MARSRGRRALCALSIALAPLATASPAHAQPQPSSTATYRFPINSALNVSDEPVAIGLWQEPDPGGLNKMNPVKVFVLGTDRSDAGTTQIVLIRYGLAGGAPEQKFFFPKYGDDLGYSFRAAKAMTIPVVVSGTAAGDGRIFITGSTDAVSATTDIVTMAPLL